MLYNYNSTIIIIIVTIMEVAVNRSYNQNDLQSIKLTIRKNTIKLLYNYVTIIHCYNQ